MNISTNELRFEFKKLLKGLRRGMPFILTYRNKPLARILPINEPAAEIPVDDPISKLHTHAENLGSLTNTEIDRVLYGRD